MIHQDLEPKPLEPGHFFLPGPEELFDVAPKVLENVQTLLRESGLLKVIFEWNCATGEVQGSASNIYERIIEGGPDFFENAAEWISEQDFTLLYVTVDTHSVWEEFAQNRAATDWHMDYEQGYLRDAREVIVCDALPTEFVTGEVDNNSSLGLCHKFLDNANLPQAVDDAINGGNVVADPIETGVAVGFTYDTIHRAARNVTENIAERIFIKIEPSFVD